MPCDFPCDIMSCVFVRYMYDARGVSVATGARARVKS